MTCHCSAISTTLEELIIFHEICFFFFNDTATTEIYTLSLHDALPISTASSWRSRRKFRPPRRISSARKTRLRRSEEHTSELQSRLHLVCRLLLEKKKKKKTNTLSQRPPDQQPPPPVRAPHFDLPHKCL